MANDNTTHLPEIRKASRAQTAEFFGVSLPTLDGWTRRGCPIEKKGAKGIQAEYDLLAVAQWKFEQAGKNSQPSSGVDPEEMTPRDRKEWLAGEEIRMRIEEKKNTLMPVEIVASIVGNMFADIKAKISSHHNTIASVYPELSTDVIHEIQRLNAEALTELSGGSFPDELQDAIQRLFDEPEAAGEDDGERVGG